MKSNRAKLAINSQATFETVRGYAVEYPVVVQAIYQAEEDAENRAIRARRLSCEYRRISNTCIYNGSHECQLDADPCKNFLEIYYDKAK